MTDPTRPRVRRLAPKVRTGCSTCKKRRVKCDERKPSCARCDKLGITCDGYSIPQAWIFKPRSSTSPPVKSDEDFDGKPVTVSLNPKSEQGQQDKPVPTDEHSLGPLINTLVPSDDFEKFVLSQSYVRFAAHCPVAWESDLYKPSRSLESMTDRDIVRLHTRTPVTRVAHLAMATATLHVFQPETYPSQVQLKYLQLAITEIRKRITEHNFEIDDLLHGISQVFLASVLTRDTKASRAHLFAAKKLVDQRGGLKAICPPTAQALQYGNLHLAIETISPPVFPIEVDEPPRDGMLDTVVLDTMIQRRAEEVRSLADRERTSLSKPLVRCFHNFADCAAVLSLAWNAPADCFDLSKIDWLASNCLATYNILLTMPIAKRLSDASVQANARITLILWIQLLCYLGNSTVVTIDVRSATTVVFNKDILTLASPAVRNGCLEWNQIMLNAKKNLRHLKEKEYYDDFLQLFDIVKSMELEQSVPITPLMSRLWELKRVYQGVDLSESLKLPSVNLSAG